MTRHSHLSIKVPEVRSTIATSINTFLAVAGYSQDAKNNYHGFVRDQWGIVTSFDPPGATEREYVRRPSMTRAQWWESTRTLPVTVYVVLYVTGEAA